MARYLMLTVSLLLFQGVTGSARGGEVVGQFVMPADAREATFIVRASVKEVRTVRIGGLAWAGAIKVSVNGEPIRFDLVGPPERGGIDPGKADYLLFTHEFPAGESRISIKLSKGAQIYHLENSEKYFGTSSDAYPHALFIFDLDHIQQNDYPVEVRIAPSFEPLAWFCGKWDNYSKHQESFTSKRGEVWTQQEGPDATLHYEFAHDKFQLPTDLTLVYDPSRKMTVIRMKQVLHAVENAVIAPDDAIEFLHVVVNPAYGRDWQDGVTDYFWNREQDESDPDTLAGSHTHFARLDDNSARRVVGAGIHHTGPSYPLLAENTIGGWISKQGVGSLALLFHSYRSTARHDMTPIQSHCGDGADTHFYIGAGQYYLPLEMKAGDEIATEYTLYALPSVLRREQVEDLNEADLYYFGNASQTKAKIRRWYGSKNVCGLIHEDGSAVLLGIGKEQESFRLNNLPGKTTRVWRVVDLGIDRVEALPIEESDVMVYPGFVTVVDAGSALKRPQ